MRRRLVAMIAAMLAPLGASGLSFVPLSVEDASDLAACAIEGSILTRETRRVGAGIFTDHAIAVTRKAGDCAGIDATATLRTIGGTLANGEGLRIEGLDPLAPGGPWVMLIRPGSDGVFELAAGPQGAIRLEPSQGGRFRAVDAAGQVVVSGHDPKTGAPRLLRRLAGTVEKWRASVKGAPTPVEGEATADLDRDAVFSAAAGRFAAKSAASRDAARSEVMQRLKGEKPGHVATGNRWEPLPRPAAGVPAKPAIRTVEQGADGETPRTVRIEPSPLARAGDCVRRPVAPGEVAPDGCDVTAAKFSFVEFADRAWNPFPPSFGSLYRLDQGLMAEWNRYADHFRVLTTPTGSYGKNYLNDVGGWPSSADLAAMYDWSWPDGTLGVTITYTWCSEITRVYLLGIFLYEYCSQTTLESDIFLNPGFTWSYDDLPVRMNTASAYSVREVLLHELGHGFGLGHSTRVAIMRSCSTRQGWLPYADDVEGARARWPGKARYSPSTNVRLVRSEGSGECRDGQGASMTSSPVTTTGTQVSVGEFLLENFHSAPSAGVSVEWYLTATASRFDPGTYAYLGSTFHGSVAPGGMVVPGAVLPLPSASFGRGYVTAYIREGAGSGNVDSAPTPIYACVGSVGFTRLDEGPPVQAYLGPYECGEQARNFHFEGASGRPERIDMRSPQFDTLLRLYGPDGTQVAVNDDFGGTLNSRIELVLPATGTYRVEATSYLGTSTGDFTLQRADPEADDDGDGLPNGDEVLEQRNGTVKDNDLFSPGLGSARLFVMQQYRDFLGRRGDGAGVQGWTGALATGSMSRAQIIDAFLASEEFAGTIAPLVRLYFATFRRVPDYGGLMFNAGLVRGGTITLAQLAEFFTASPEFQALYGPLDNMQFVTLLYTNVLGRAPDAAGLAGWASLLQSGYSRGQVLLGFSESIEHRSAKAGEAYVTMMYAGMLRRSPEPDGYNGWLAYLNVPNSPLSMINGFFLSTEYHNRFLP